MLNNKEDHMIYAMVGLLLTASVAGVVVLAAWVIGETISSLNRTRWTMYGLGMLVGFAILCMCIIAVIVWIYMLEPAMYDVGYRFMVGVLHMKP
jgi:hypothetical protein